MPQKSINIFDSIDSYKLDFVRIIYKQLMTKDWVSYVSVYTEWSGEEIDLATETISSQPKYGELQKAFKSVRDEIEKVSPGSIESNGKTKGVAYRYVGENSDPLQQDKDVLSHLVRKSISDYSSFCQASLGLLPQGWHSHFFENTQDLINAQRASESWSIPLRSGMEQTLVNIELLPHIFDAIVEKKVLKIGYKPFDRKFREYTFHPQFLKEYNYRWFLLGEAEEVKCYPFVISIDRIKGELITLDRQYHTAETGFYKRYFADIVGVRNDEITIEPIVIKTHTKYMHNLILSKPWHITMHQMSKFKLQPNGEKYGLITLSVKPNVELQGKLLMYGSQISVVSPPTLRDSIYQEIKSQLKHYE